MITAAQALEALAQAVERKGEGYVYTDQATGIRAGTDEWYDKGVDCRYAGPDGEPACIVGTALSIADRAAFEAVRVIEAADGSFPAIHLHRGTKSIPVVATADAANVFYWAQTVQDSGATWGEALGAARKYAAEVAEQEVTA